MRAIVTGAAGQLGCELVPLLRAAGHDVAESDIATLDIGDAAAVEALAAYRPQIVFNCAAYTDVDGCETNPDLARRGNVEGPTHLARLAEATGALLVHYSTDFVFDGTASRPYLETDPANPISEYGRSKLEGEIAVQRLAGDHLLIRTSWVYGKGPKNFVLAIARQVRQGRPVLRVVADQRGSPTFASDLAEATLYLLAVRARGIVNFCNSGDCTRYEYAVEINRVLGGASEICPCSSAEIPQPARRPAYSTLDTSLYRRLTGRTPRPWSEALRAYLA